MAKLRSPNYPDIDIQQAIDLIGKLYTANRTFPMDRDVAAKEMGYSGLTGPSAKKIASLIQYGLLDKHAKNEVKVSRVAEAILHPDDQTQKEENLQVSAYMPSLFADLRERFPGGVPSESNLKSYLLKQGFSDRAVGPAIRAYLGTCSYVEKKESYESHGSTSVEMSESPVNQRFTGDSDMESAAEAHPLPQTDRLDQSAAPNLNAMNVGVFGGQVRINVLLDSKGLDKLERKIAALRELIADELDEPRADEGQALSGAEDKNEEQNT